MPRGLSEGLSLSAFPYPHSLLEGAGLRAPWPCQESRAGCEHGAAQQDTSQGTFSPDPTGAFGSSILMRTEITPAALPHDATGSRATSIPFLSGSKTRNSEGGYVTALDPWAGPTVRAEASVICRQRPSWSLLSHH